MDINALLATIVLTSFIVTVVLAVGSYVAYKLRERRRPRGNAAAGEGPVFFERFFPPATGASTLHAPANDVVAD